MDIISIEHSDRLFWLGRYTERVYTTLLLFANSYDIMIDGNDNDYIDFCNKLDIPNIYTSNSNFVMNYCFEKEDVNSIYSNLIRAYDNAIVLREEISSEALSYIQLAIYDMEKAKLSKAPLIALQKIIDDLMAFWGMIDDKTDNTNARNIIKTGKHIERLSLYGRLQSSDEKIATEVNRLLGRIQQTKLFYQKNDLEELYILANEKELNYLSIVKKIEHLIWGDNFYMKNLSFHYHMSIEFEDFVTKHRFTLKCIPKNDDYQTITDLNYEVYPNDFIDLSYDSYSNNTLIGYVEKEHEKFYIDVVGKASVDGNREKTVYKKHEVAFYKYPTKITKVGETLKEYFSAFTFSKGISNLEKALIMMRKLYCDFEYKKNVTSLTTTSEEALTLKKGVCQDYAQIMISLCNLAEIPARYVAGLLVGEGFSHAWIEIFNQTENEKGVWVALDPTNNLIVDDSHIKISTGRDYSDCLINQGVFFGGGHQKQEISVIVYESNR